MLFPQYLHCEDTIVDDELVWVLFEILACKLAMLVCSVVVSSVILSYNLFTTLLVGATSDLLLVVSGGNVSLKETMPLCVVAAMGRLSYWYAENTSVQIVGLPKML